MTNLEQRDPFKHLEEATIVQLQNAMATNQLTARQLVEMYIQRIDALDQHGPSLKSILEINPAALHIAEELDRERKLSGPCGPLHGIPILLKDKSPLQTRCKQLQDRSHC